MQDAYGHWAKEDNPQLDLLLPIFEVLGGKVLSDEHLRARSKATLQGIQSIAEDGKLASVSSLLSEYDRCNAREREIIRKIPFALSLVDDILGPSVAVIKASLDKGAKQIVVSVKRGDYTTCLEVIPAVPMLIAFKSRNVVLAKSLGAFLASLESIFAAILEDLAATVQTPVTISNGNAVEEQRSGLLGMFDGPIAKRIAAFREASAQSDALQRRHFIRANAGVFDQTILVCLFGIC